LAKVCQEKAINYALKDQIMAVDSSFRPAIGKGFALWYKETRELVEESERVLSLVLFRNIVNSWVAMPFLYSPGRPELRNRAWLALNE